jgi:hypothetical protein
LYRLKGVVSRGRKRKVLLHERTAEIGSTSPQLSEHRYSASHHPNPSEKCQDMEQTSLSND